MQDPGVDHGDRSGRGRAERDGDGDRAGGAFRSRANASVARARGPRRRAELLHPGDGQTERHRARAHPHAGGFERRLLHRRDGSEAARAGRILRDEAIGSAGACRSATSCAITDVLEVARNEAQAFVANPPSQDGVRARRRRTSAIIGSGATAWCRWAESCESSGESFAAAA